VLCCAVLCCAVLCCAVRCCAVWGGWMGGWVGLSWQILAGRADRPANRLRFRCLAEVLLLLLQVIRSGYLYFCDICFFHRLVKKSLVGWLVDTNCFRDHVVFWFRRFMFMLLMSVMVPLFFRSQLTALRTAEGENAAWIQSLALVRKWAEHPKLTGSPSNRRAKWVECWCWCWVDSCIQSACLNNLKEYTEFFLHVVRQNSFRPQWFP